MSKNNLGVASLLNNSFLVADPGIRQDSKNIMTQQAPRVRPHFCSHHMLTPSVQQTHGNMGSIC